MVFLIFVLQKVDFEKNQILKWYSWFFFHEKVDFDKKSADDKKALG